MYLANRVDPGHDLFRFFLSFLDGVDLFVLASRIFNILGSQLEVHFGTVRLVEGGFVLYLISFTSTYNPKVSGSLSGLGILRKASTSPMAGMYSGTKALSLVSSSRMVGVYLNLKLFTSGCF